VDVTYEVAAENLIKPLIPPEPVEEELPEEEDVKGGDKPAEGGVDDQG